jgi:hypothetical protein
MVFSLLVLFPVTGHTATETSKTVSKSASTAASEAPSGKTVAANKAAPAAPAAAKPTAKEAVANAFTRAVEAGKEAAKRALSSKAKAAKTEATPAALPEGKKKYVFEYPEPAVIDETMEPVNKTIEGEVGVVIKMGMNVEFDRSQSSASDLWVEFAKGIETDGVKSVGEFLPGDKVRVSYEETKDSSKRVVRSIKLIKRKTEEEKKREAEAEARAEAAAAEKLVSSEES